MMIFEKIFFTLLIKQKGKNSCNKLSYYSLKNGIIKFMQFQTTVTNCKNLMLLFKKKNFEASLSPKPEFK